MVHEGNNSDNPIAVSNQSGQKDFNIEQPVDWIRDVNDIRAKANSVIQSYYPSGRRQRGRLSGVMDRSCIPLWEDICVGVRTKELVEYRPLPILSHPVTIECTANSIRNIFLAALYCNYFALILVVYLILIRIHSVCRKNW